MAVDVTNLSPVPRSLGPSPGGQRHRLQKKHGRQYSVQLDIDQQPIDHEGGSELQDEHVLPVAGPGPHSNISNSSHQPEHTHLEVPRSSRPRPKLETDHISLPSRSSNLSKNSPQASPQDQVSPEELFARRFGYGVSSPASITPVEPPTPPLEDVFPSLPTRPRPHKRRFARFDEEEGNLVVLPPPLLLRPRSFWHNTRDTALHTPSYQLVRRATFLAAGLSLDSPVSDLSALAVESRITVGKAGGVGGSAALPVGLAVFG